MLKFLIRPDGLFLLGTLQAVFPYAFWMMNGVNDKYDYRLTFIPGLIYLVGFCCFLIGCRLASHPKLKPVYFHNLQSWHSFLVTSLFLLLIVCGIQIFGLIRVYGGIPLLAFSSGELSIADADEMLEDSATGQMALLLSSLNLLAGFYLLHLIERIQSHRFHLFSFINLVTCLTFLIGLTMGGKRQGLVMTGFFIVIGLYIIFQDTLDTLLKQLISRFKSFRLVYVLAGIIAVFGGFELIGKLRSGRDITFSENVEAFKYLELPLINFEFQVEMAGIGPNQFAPEGLLRTLLPRRFTQSMNFEKPAKLEPTSPSGYYGELHWFTGLPGILLFALLSGYASNMIFLRARYHPFWLFTYCQIAWTLISCHTYNHFLNLTFIPLPVIVFFIICFSFFPYHRNRYVFSQTTHPQKRNLQLQ